MWAQEGKGDVKPVLLRFVEVEESCKELGKTAGRSSREAQKPAVFNHAQI